MTRKPMTLRTAAINAAETTQDAQDIPTLTPVVPAPAHEPIKRLTLDMPASLHKKIKIMAMEEGTSMANMIRIWLEKRIK